MTNEITSEELQRLKALALRATPGPWESNSIHSEGEYGSDDDGGYGFTTYEVTDGSGLCIMGCLNNDDGAVHVGDDGHAWDDVAKRDAAYVAAANPASILALIAKVESLAADAERYSAFFSAGLPICFMGEDYENKADLDAAIDAYRAKEKA